MAGSKSDYLENLFLDTVLGGTNSSTYVAPATDLGPASVWIGLWTTAGSLDDTSTGDAANEVSTSGTGYGRLEVVNNTSNWPAAASGVKQNGQPITWDPAELAWGTINQFAICDDETSGNILFWGDITTPKTINLGDTASFSSGSLTITEN
jgi:hypothetical protein